MIQAIVHFFYRRIAPLSHARWIGVRMGEGCRLIDVSFGSEPWLVTLGDRVSASNVSFITHDGGVWVMRAAHPDIEVVAPINVGNNVFIGSGTYILPGVTIGDNVVIGAGSVVTKDIPSDSVSAGVPARVLSTLANYCARSLERSAMTKGLTEAQKKKHYLAKFLKSTTGYR